MSDEVSDGVSIQVAEFEVGITYCDGVSLAHRYDGDRAVRQATVEYADMIAEALVPSLTNQNARHVRMVTLLGYDSDGRPVRHVHSGIFVCEHKGWE